MKTLPKQYSWLKSENNIMIVQALKLYGTKEIIGNKHNPIILGWAESLGIPSLVKDDEQAWCALSHSYVIKQCGYELEPVKGYGLIRAASFAAWGNEAIAAMLGDTLVFKRNGGHHVGIYVGEDQTCFHVLGGNQGNEYNVTRIEKTRLFAIRRPLNQGITKKIFLSFGGEVSENES